MLKTLHDMSTDAAFKEQLMAQMGELAMAETATFKELNTTMYGVVDLVSSDSDVQDHSDSDDSAIIVISTGDDN